MSKERQAKAVSMGLGDDGMFLKNMLLLALIALSLHLNGVDGRRRRILSREEDLELDRQLKILRKPAAKTIKTEYGEIFDCVDINKQPALDHPLLKNHTVETSPGVFPRSKTAEEKSSSMGITLQIGLKDGGCPQGTVPIRRVTKEDLTRDKSRTESMEDGLTTIHYAVLKWRPGMYRHYGIKGTLNVWQPRVIGTQYSGSQIIVYDDTSAIKAGWRVEPGLYRDNLTHLYTVWTADNYQKTGCVDARCPGFIQVAKDLPLGIVISPVSTYNGKQYAFPLAIYKDPVTKNWWLLHGGKQVGYWPRSLFTSQLADYAHKINWGGMVYNPTPADHNWPPMGSGHYADEGFKKAAYIKSMGKGNEDGTFEEVHTSDLLSTFDVDCYWPLADAYVPGGEENMMYGGRGGNC